jgi:hypothetical protein
VLARAVVTRVAAALSLLAGMVVLVLGLLNPSPLALDLGPGDDAFLQSQTGAWKAFERRGPVQYRSTGPELTLLWPLAARGERLVVDVRLARFADRPAEISVFLGSKRIARWEQRPGGWRVRSLDAGAIDGPVVLSFRIAAEDPQESGIALDWVMLRGVDAVRPSGAGWAGLAVLLLGIPLALAAARRSPTAGLLCAGLAGTLVGCALMVDAAATLATARVVVGRIGFVALVLSVVGSTFWRFSIVWRRLPLACHIAPAAFALLALLGLSIPRFHHPDVDTHSRFLSAIKQRPATAVNPLAFQREARTWTRLINGEWRGLPYSPAFHLLAVAPSLGLGVTGALKALAAAVAACSLWLVAVAAMRLGGSGGSALLAQVIFGLLPVMASRLSLALWPALLGQLLEIGLVLALLRFSGGAAGSGVVGAGAVMLVTMMSYTGCLVSVGCVTAVFACRLIVSGDRRRGLTLLAMYAAAFLVVLVGQYHYYLPLFWRDILPGLGKDGAGGASAEAAGRLFYRLWFFYGYYCAAVVLACGLLWRGQVTRRALLPWLSAGLALGILRAGMPTMLGDLKEVELLAAPVALCVALAYGGVRLNRRRAFWLAAALCTLVAWGAWRSLQLYSACLRPPVWSATN